MKNMLKALLPHLMNLALAGMATAQNLVPNSSFEDTTHCDNFVPPYEEALGWYSANNATPDIWDTDTSLPCGSFMDSTDQGIQIIGYSPAFEGQRFAGALQWKGPGGSNTRDYFQIELLSELEASKAYRVALYCARPKGFRRAIDHIGVYFSLDSVFLNAFTTLPYVPQAQLRDPNNAYLIDTTWVQLADTFVAIGGERWLVFGTFLEDDDVNGIDLPPLFPDDDAYYYIDAVSVQPILHESVNATARPAMILWANGLAIGWQGEQPLDALMVYDTGGRIAWQPVLARSSSGLIAIPEDLAAGTYMVFATSADKPYRARFIK